MTDGYVIVPRVATDKMVTAGSGLKPVPERSEFYETTQNIRGDAQSDYTAMISAAPSAGRVSRKRLREALDRANHAGRAEWQDLYEGNVSPLDLARKAERQAEDALAAALGIEIAEE